MKALTYIFRMALRRKAACLLVLLFTAAATVFMLFYPNLIDSTRLRLEEAYDSIPVSGWIINTADHNDPAVSAETWKDIQESPYFSELYASGRFNIRAFSKTKLSEKAGSDPNRQKILQAFQTLLIGFDTALDEGYGFSGNMRSYNSFSANDELMRIKDDIQWLDGYDESCLEGNERVCILSSDWGYEPGDEIPMLARILVNNKDFLEGIFRVTVVGTYPGKITEFSAVMPLKTHEDLCETATQICDEVGNYYSWDFKLNSLHFTVRDNRQLDEIKNFFAEKGFNSESGIKAKLDERIFKGTVEPIKSNLSMLESLYRFFFAMIICIGFFLSFLLARGRKAEYAVMRMLGESRLQVTFKALFEQTLLCLFGVLIAAAAVGYIVQNNVDAKICGLVLLCYSSGAAFAVVLTVRVKVMEILQNKD